MKPKSTAIMILFSLLLLPVILYAQDQTSCADDLGTTSKASEILSCLANIQREVNILKEQSIPAGAVVAFRSGLSNPCPGKDWKIYDRAIGRFVVGAGHSRENGLTPRVLEDEGGYESVELTEAQMPTHNHPISRNDSSGADFLAGSQANYGISENFNKGDRAKNNLTGQVGEGKPHNNMPPFIALYWCIKM